MMNMMHGLVLRLTLNLIAGTMIGTTLMTVQSRAQPAEAVDISDAAADYDRLLKAHVDDRGLVDYSALADDPSALDRYVASLADPGLLDENHSEDRRLATLINAYNAFTLKLIVDHGGGDGLDSILDLHDGKPWDQEIWTLAGQEVSLNQIEHEYVRPVFDEPRIHWALVCAAYSCPPLRAEAYTAEQLGRQLADQEHRVLQAGDDRFVQIRDGRAKVTRLFEWYGQDFGDWKTYVNERLPQAPLQFDDFLEYDWKLNGQ